MFLSLFGWHFLSSVECYSDICNSFITIWMTLVIFRRMLFRYITIWMTLLIFRRMLFLYFTIWMTLFIFRIMLFGITRSWISHLINFIHHFFWSEKIVGGVGGVRVSRVFARCRKIREKNEMRVNKVFVRPLQIKWHFIRMTLRMPRRWPIYVGN